jgi:UDP-N-acetylglucosamine 2-epimerase (non-hydrolysing)
VTPADQGDRPRVLVTIGTRPEGIKLAPVVRALQQRDEVEVRVALTGQHTTLMDQVIDVFQLPVHWDLEIMREGQDLYDVAHGCLNGLRDVTRAYRPQIILVQGDTATVCFAALVAFFERILVGHVEAGLRSGNKWQPYPEEIFRRIAGVTADLHFAPTAQARDNLLRENVPEDQIHVTGNTVVDALLSIASNEYQPRDAQLSAAIKRGGRLILVTAHRRESFGAPLREAFAAIRELADRFDDIAFLYPVHPNPEVRAAARDTLQNHPQILLTEPLDYFDLLYALRHSAFALTDSGGIQEEAPTFGTPVLVMREVTERPEGLRAGVATLVGTRRDRIVQEATRLLTESRTPERPNLRTPELPHLQTSPPNPYGDGKAGERIADIVVQKLTGAARRTRDWTPA